MARGSRDLPSLRQQSIQSVLYFQEASFGSMTLVCGPIDQLIHRSVGHVAFCVLLRACVRVSVCDCAQSHFHTITIFSCN